MRPLLRCLAWATPALLAYIGLAPLGSLWLDHILNPPAFPDWTRWIALLLIAPGLLIAGWTIWLFASIGRGTPNPLAPPEHLVVEGPYRYSRNPMMLAGWLAGIGLALALGSPVYLAFCMIVIVAGTAYVPLIEEPRLVARFGDAYLSYMRSTPRWIGVHLHGLSDHACCR